MSGKNEASAASNQNDRFEVSYSLPISRYGMLQQQPYMPQIYHNASNYSQQYPTYPNYANYNYPQLPPVPPPPPPPPQPTVNYNYCCPTDNGRIIEQDQNRRKCHRHTLRCAITNSTPSTSAGIGNSRANFLQPQKAQTRKKKGATKPHRKPNSKPWFKFKSKGAKFRKFSNDASPHGNPFSGPVSGPNSERVAKRLPRRPPPLPCGDLRHVLQSHQRARDQSNRSTNGPEVIQIDEQEGDSEIGNFSGPNVEFY